MVQAANTIFRDFVTDGVPASGANKPKKSEVRAWGTSLESMIGAGLSNGGLIYDTKASMDADLAHDANASAWVMEGAEAGIYRKSGASGSGSWSRIADLPYSLVYAQNDGSGTADAVKATASTPVSAIAYSQLISVPFAAANTGSMTLSINGETPRLLVTNTGAAIPAGYVSAGMSALVQIDGNGNYRLFSYGDASAIQIAVESLLVLVENAKAAAELSASGAGIAASVATSAANTAQMAAQVSGSVSIFDTYADAAAAASGLDEGRIVEVLSDSNKNGRRTRYRIQSGALVYKISLDPVRTVQTPVGGYVKFYVRPDGDDANDGLSDTSTGAFKTIARAVDVVWNYSDGQGREAYIYVADGTYTDAIVRQYPSVGFSRVNLIGNQPNPENCLLDVDGSGIQMYNGAAIIAKGFKIKATARGLYAAWGGTIWFEDIDFGQCGSYHIRASAGHIWLIGDGKYKISGGAPAHYSAHISGTIDVVAGASPEVTLTGTPNFTVAFALAENAGSIEASGMTYTGAATGRKWTVGRGGSMILGTNVNPDTLFPGSIGGFIRDPGAISPTGRMVATSISSNLNTLSIADDGVVTFNLLAVTEGFVLLLINSIGGAKSTTPAGMFRARAGAAPNIENINLDLTGVVLTTGALTGTTGADGKFTIAVHTDGLLYLENRTGSSKQINLLAI